MNLRWDEVAELKHHTLVIPRKGSLSMERKRQPPFVCGDDGLLRHHSETNSEQIHHHL